MRRSRTKTGFGFAAALYVLHNDWWFWDDPQLVLGLPVGLCYHLLFCLASSIMLLLFVFGERDSKSDIDMTRR